MTSGYVHGYDLREELRLEDQAQTLEILLHGDTRYAPGSLVLEAGCGVGAQTVTLAASSPGARIVSADISETSLAAAREKLVRAGVASVDLIRADIFRLPFAAGAFDHVFVCFVLEHLPDPAEALRVLRGFLKPGGTLTVIEGDHGTVCFHPESLAARRAVACQVELQGRSGGDANVGRRLHPLLAAAGLERIRVSPRQVYVDANRPDLADGFIRKTFTAMIAGVREQALKAHLTTPEEFDLGVADLHRTAEPDGMFSYTFFKGVAVKPKA